jgi:hypothetical protein
MVLQGMLMLAMMQNAAPPLTTAAEVVERMVQADNERLAVLAGYTGMRRYRFENKRVGKRAEMTVRVTCDSAGVKTFQIVAESGSGFVRSRILHKIIDAEREASQKGERDKNRIIPENYDFQLIGQDVSDGRDQYVLEIIPKTKNKFLTRGRIWVDAADFAISRIEGSPAQNPSFWVRSVKVLHRYQPFGRFWLPVANESHAQARVFGATDVSIEYFDYVTDTRQARQQGQQAEEGGQ